MLGLVARRGGIEEQNTLASENRDALSLVAGVFVRLNGPASTHVQKGRVLRVVSSSCTVGKFCMRIGGPSGL